jgi:hypothetical protein
MVEHYAGYPLEFHPGTGWSYSVSTDICARLVEIISGQRFDDRRLTREAASPIAQRRVPLHARTCDWPSARVCVVTRRPFLWAIL